MAGLNWNQVFSAMGPIVRGNCAVDDGTIIECRRCGTKLDVDGGTCPACGSREIARYELE